MQYFIGVSTELYSGLLSVHQDSIRLTSTENNSCIPCEEASRACSIMLVYLFMVTDQMLQHLHLQFPKQQVPD